MGRRLEDLDDWLEVQALAKWSPETSALYRATHPEWRITPELQFLRDMEYHLSWLAWTKTDGAKYGRGRPQPHPLTEAERNAQRPERDKYRPKPVQDILAWLGWTKPKG